MHDKHLIVRGGAGHISHDLLQEWEEELHQVIQGGSVLVNLILVRLEDFFESEKARDQNALMADALLDAVAYFLHRVLPVLWEVNLGDVIYHTTECALNDLGGSHVECLENVITEELLVPVSQGALISAC